MLRTWNPADSWGVGFWNGAADPQNYKRMKVKLSLSTLTDDELADLLDTVHAKMTDNAATFTGANPTMAQLAALSVAQRSAIAGRATALTAADAALETLRAASAATRAGLSLEGSFMENRAAGNAAIIAQAGMGVRAAQASIGAMSQVQGLKTTMSDHAGAVDWMCKPAKGASAYIVQSCTGNPAVEANWHYADTATKSSGTLSGLASGKVFVRLCAKGADAANGAWSNIEEETVR